jgi:hydroxypyruvate isomerase
MFFSELPFRDRFAAAKKAGFNAIEIQFPYEIDLAELVQLQQQHDLKIVLINVSADDLLQGGEGLAAVPSKQAQFDKALENCVRYARQLNVSCVNVLPGRCFDDALKNNYLTTFKQNLKIAADVLQKINVKCTFEAINTVDMPHFLINSPVQMTDVISELEHPNIFMQYDIYHMTKMGRDVCADIAEFHQHIGHIQFADCPGRHEPGTGNINFESVFNAINKCGYGGWVGAEYIPSKKTQNTLSWYQISTS